MLGGITPTNIHRNLLINSKEDDDVFYVRIWKILTQFNYDCIDYYNRVGYGCII